MFGGFSNKTAANPHESVKYTANATGTEGSPVMKSPALEFLALLRTLPCLKLYRGAQYRGPKDHINRRILHSGSKAQYKRHTRNSVLWNPYVYVVFLGPYNTIRCLTAPSPKLGLNQRIIWSLFGPCFGWGGAWLGVVLGSMILLSSWAIVAGLCCRTAWVSATP